MRASTFNYLLMALGGLMIVLELALGAVTGFDFALLGVAVAAGGGVGLYFDSIRVGLFAAGALSFVYIAFFRGWIRSKLAAPARPAGVDALKGKRGVVTVRIAANEPGQVKVDDETWRAVLAAGASGARETGAEVTVESVDGVTVLVR